MNLYLIAGGVAFVVVFVTLVAAQWISVAFARWRGVYPKRGQVTADDVMVLVKRGKQALAVRAYRELHQTGLAEAARAIQSMARESEEGSKSDQVDGS